MYLRRVKCKDGYDYVLRESYASEGGWRHRDLMNLGKDPSEHIKYPGGNGFYFDPRIEETLEGKGVDYSTEELEEIFLPFLDPHIRRVVEMFMNDRQTGGPWSAFTEEELLKHQQALHSFDKRRLHFLRCGRIDIGDLEGRPWKFLNVLLGKGRDEIEHILDGMEQRLRPQEIRSYLYTAFHLQAYFPGHLTRNHPVALDPDKVDTYFLEEICLLNNDAFFFRGINGRGNGRLHPYLEKYVILYFDHDFEASYPWNEYIKDFMGRYRSCARPRAEPDMDVKQAVGILGISKEEFDRMTRKDLVRYYRKKAKKIHPDKGGEHEAFVQLAAAYEYLLSVLV